MAWYYLDARFFLLKKKMEKQPLQNTSNTIGNPSDDFQLKKKKEEQMNEGR